jgi:hypothetical protein
MSLKAAVFNFGPKPDNEEKRYDEADTNRIWLKV